MGNDIGAKLSEARKARGLTQEQAAELIGVSRQTISNWENEKSYPDIISVIKMSDHYQISLDALLKGEKQMTSYYDYLEESTNVVKSNSRKTRIALVLAYLLIWAVAMVAFWCFMGESDALGYSLMFLWVILPVTTFVVSLLIGRLDCWGRWKWAAPVILGIMYMLAEYGTFSMANNIAFDHVNMPEWGMIPAGAVISVIGILVGMLTVRRKKEK